MASPVLRINPRLPLVWRNPSTLQIGVDPPVVVIGNLSEHALGRPIAPAQEATSRTSETVLVGNYVLDPVLYRACLSIDLPHTPVVFQDQWVVIGPRVTPGSGPCLHCVWANAVSITPHHQAVMSQLWRKLAPAEPSEMALLATTAVLELVSKPQRDRSLRIDALSHFVSERWETPSNECRGRNIAVV